MMHYILNIWVVDKYNANDHSSSQISITIQIIINACCYVTLYDKLHYTGN